MWIIVAMLLTGKSTVPLALGPEIAFIHENDCKAAAAIVAPQAAKQNAALICRHYVIAGGKQAEAF